jgi:hypothetical protein
MPRPLFRPTARQACWLLIVGVLAVGFALYERYMVMQVPEKALACMAGLDTWICRAHKIALNFYQYHVFGTVALAAAILNLVRPSIVLVTVALFSGGLGIVLHNVALSALSVALLLISLARPAPVPE